MARKLRVQYPGAIYHVMDCGDRRERIFKDDTDRHRFLGTLVQKGWFLGAPELKEQLLEQMETQMGAHHGGTEKRETDEQKAERMVASELSKRHWTEEDLKQRRKTDATKVKMALRLRRETVMTMDWIAERLHLGCRHTLANCIKAAKINNSRD